MRPPSENLRSKLSTFHSMSEGGRLVGLLKKISYSIFRRRSCESRRFSSSSVVTGVSMNSVVTRRDEGEVPEGHQGEWNESKGQISTVSSQPSVRQNDSRLWSSRDTAGSWEVGWFS